jgi:hypothetical protein
VCVDVAGRPPILISQCSDSKSEPLGPVAASGKGLDLLFVDYFRVANEKIVECEVVRDRLGMMIQLGAVPAK